MLGVLPTGFDLSPDLVAIIRMVSVVRSRGEERQFNSKSCQIAH